MEKGPNFEIKNQIVDLSNPDLIERLTLLFSSVDERLDNDWLAEIQAYDAEEQTVKKSEFIAICEKLSLQPESLIEWDRDYFDDQFEETVRIVKERRSYNITEGE